MERSESARGRGRVFRHGAFAWTFVGLALVLLCWPLFYSPRPSLRLVFLAMYAIWGAVVALIAWMSRHLEPEEVERERGDDG